MKKFLKVVGILAVFIAAILYFVFRIMFFDPFEGEFARMDTLIPRDAEIMVRRQELSRDFVDFPIPDFYDTLRLKREWKEFTKTSSYGEIAGELELGSKIEELRSQLEQMKPLDIMADVLGREVMVVGRPREDGTFALAALFRGSFRAKAAVEALGVGFLRGLAGDSIASYEKADGVSAITLATGEKVSLFRQQDVIIASQDRELIADIYKIARGSGLSLADSPQYAAAMAQDSDVGRAIDFAIHVGNVAEANGVARFEGDEYDPMKEWLSQSIALGDYGLALGRIFLGDEIQIDARLGADLASLRPSSGGIYSGSSGSLQELYDFCGNVFPEDVFACGYVKLDVGAFFRRLESCLDQDTRELLNEFVASIKRRNPRLPISNSMDFVTYLGDCVANEMAFALEPQSPYHIPQTPENQIVFPEKSWGPRLALLFPTSNRGLAEGLLNDVTQSIKSSADRFARVYNWSYQAQGISFQEIELLDADYPSLSIGFFEIEGRDFMVFTTTGQFLSEIARVKIDRDRDHNSGVSETVQFQLAESAVDGFGQGFMYLTSEGLTTSLANLIEWQVEMDTQPDWTTLRGQAERTIRDQRYPQERGQELTLERRRELNPIVDEEMDRIELEWRGSTVPQEVEVRRQNLKGVELLKWLGLTFRVNDRDIELHARISTAANFPH